MRGEVWGIAAVAVILCLGWWTEQRLEAVVAAVMMPVVMVLVHRWVARTRMKRRNAA